MTITGNMPLKFKPFELHHFSWIYNLAPCFAVSSSKISIITDPRKFYDTLCERFKNAQRRISIASLYIGTGPLEQKLLEVTKDSIRFKKLRFKALLDYQRGTRGFPNSRSMLQQFIDEMPDQCSVALYQTPRLQGVWSKALPSRYNEIVGLQHIKLYIADDSVIISGANCSNDYFAQRQDRYIEIEDPNLADFYNELIDEVSSFSKKCWKGEEDDLGRLIPKEEITRLIRGKIQDFIDDWITRQKSKVHTNSNNTDTWVFPLIQMGEFGIRQDEVVTLKYLSSVPKGSYLQLATGYFNLTEQYASALLKDCKANISLLMAHPNANGFLGASGPAGGIPYAYSLIAKKFWARVVNSNQASRVQMLEYERPGWTFHAKGLWYYPPGSDVPWGTIVGSANLGERSVKRDLEAQAAIFTSSKQLQEALRDECVGLHAYAQECSRPLRERPVPLWVRATVGLFRTYF